MPGQQRPPVKQKNNTIIDYTLKGLLVIVLCVCWVLSVGPLVDAWVSYGVITGVFATVLLGVPLVLATGVVVDILRV